MNKKTDYPDLEKLPNCNFWKHLFWFWWNRPRIFAEDIYEKYVLKPKMDKENAEYTISADTSGCDAKKFKKNSRSASVKSRT